MIETLRAARAAGPVKGFEAVLNGTVNFMLTRLQAGADFADALADARAAGFAEEDPSSDLEGRDSAAKVRLLAFEAFGRTPAEADVPCAELSDAFKPAGPVRQIGACFRDDAGLKASVSLDVGLDDPFFQSLNGERNGLKVHGEDGRVWTCKGRGAGRWPTTESVLADLADIVRSRHASLGHH
jgi:homoserine dehydrogenase